MSSRQVDIAKWKHREKKNEKQYTIILEIEGKSHVGHGRFNRSVSGVPPKRGERDRGITL